MFLNVQMGAPDREKIRVRFRANSIYNLEGILQTVVQRTCGGRLVWNFQI